MLRTRTYIFIIVVAFVVALMSFLLGMNSGLQQDRAYQTLRDIKARLDGSEQRHPSTPIFNEFDQLVWYGGKLEVPSPPLRKNQIVAFAFGQSNAANHGGEKFLSNNDKLLNFWNGKFYLASDPLLGASGTSGSVWTAVGHHLIENELADQVIIIAAGITRTSVLDWADGGRLNAMLIQRLEAAKHHKLEVNHFYWHQGEHDYATPGNVYLEHLQKIIAATKLYFPNSKFFVAQASMCKTTPSSLELLQAQRKATALPGVYLGPNTDTIARADRYDDCHFSGRGLSRAAQAWVEAIAAAEKQKAQPQ